MSLCLDSSTLHSLVCYWKLASMRYVGCAYYFGNRIFICIDFYTMDMATWATKIMGPQIQIVMPSLLMKLETNLSWRVLESPALCVIISGNKNPKYLWILEVNTNWIKSSKIWTHTFNLFTKCRPKQERYKKNQKEKERRQSCSL